MGRRIKFEDSVKIVEAINDGSLEKVETYTFKNFNFQVPVHVEGIKPELLHPEKTWHSKIEYEESLNSLVIEFIENFNKKYKGKMGEYSESIEKASPVL